MMRAPTANPIVVMAKMEIAMLEGAGKVGGALLGALGQMCDLVGGVACAGDKRCHDDSPRDPDFTSHYGRRAHDIDPERDV